MDKKLKLLKELDEQGVPYCSEKSFEENPCGIGVVEDKRFTFEDVKQMPYEWLNDFKNEVK